MWRMQDKPDSTARMINGTEVRPVATLVLDGPGTPLRRSRAHIIVDDHCYMIIMASSGRGPCTKTPWIFAEALAALRKLPDPT